MDQSFEPYFLAEVSFEILEIQNISALSQCEDQRTICSTRQAAPDGGLQ